MTTLINNLVDYNFYLDLYQENTLTISTSSNGVGQITKDDNGNYLNTIITNGRRNIYECTSLPSNLILYDDSNFVYIDSTFDEDDIEYRFLLKQLNNARYYRNADREEPDSVSGYVLSLDMSGKEVFKIYANGNEIISYTKTDTDITITGNDTIHITGVEDFIRIYTYTTNQVVSGTTTFKFKGANDIIPDEADLIDESFFSDKIDICDRFDDNFSISNNKTFGNFDRTFEYTIEKDENNRDMKITFVQFGDDLREQVRNQNFRVLAWNKNESKMYIFNNCYWNDGENTTFQKTKNENTISFDLEEVLLLEYKDNTVYGSGIYGDGYYSGYKAVNLTDVIS